MNSNIKKKGHPLFDAKNSLGSVLPRVLYCIFVLFLYINNTIKNITHSSSLFENVRSK